MEQRELTTKSKTIVIIIPALFGTNKTSIYGKITILEGNITRQYIIIFI